MDYMNYLQSLIRKKERVGNIEDIEKLETLKELFQKSDCFNDLTMEVAFDILSFLGVPEKEIVDLYFNLISPKPFMETPKVRITESKLK